MEDEGGPALRKMLEEPVDHHEVERGKRDAAPPAGESQQVRLEPEERAASARVAGRIPGAERHAFELGTGPRIEPRARVRAQERDARLLDTRERARGHRQRGRSDVLHVLHGRQIEERALELDAEVVVAGRLVQSIAARTCASPALPTGRLSAFRPSVDRASQA